MIDFDFAIARLDDEPNSTALSALRDRYPELGFIFDELNDLREVASKYGDPAQLERDKQDAQSEAKYLYNLIDEAEARFAQIRDMALILARMDKVLKSDIGKLADTADNAQHFIAKRKSA